MWGQLKTLALRYKLFWFHCVQLTRELTPWGGISAVATTVKAKSLLPPGGATVCCQVFCICPCPLVFTRMFTWSSAGLFTAVISRTNSKEAEKRMSFHNSYKHRGRTVMSATSWLVDAFFSVSFMSKHVHLKTEQELILYRVFTSFFPLCFWKKGEKKAVSLKMQVILISLISLIRPITDQLQSLVIFFVYSIWL